MVAAFLHRGFGAQKSTSHSPIDLLSVLPQTSVFGDTLTNPHIRPDFFFIYEIMSAYDNCFKKLQLQKCNNLLKEAEKCA